MVAIEKINPEDRQRAQQLALWLAKNFRECDRQKLIVWLQRMRTLASSDQPPAVKLREAMISTSSFVAIMPMIRTLGRQATYYAANKRAMPVKMAVVAGLGALAFGRFGSSAGAPIGAAFSLPLWLVFASGAALSTALIEELTKLPGSTPA